MTLEKKIVYILGMILITLQGILEFMQMNQISTVATDVETAKVEIKEKVQDSEEDVIKEAEVVADKLAPVNEIIESWGQPAAAPEPASGLINLDKLIPPEDRAKIEEAYQITKRLDKNVAALREAADYIASNVAMITANLTADDPIEPTPAADEPPDPAPVAEGGPPQEPQPPTGPWRPTQR